jgi:hypothetical protein
MQNGMERKQLRTFGLTVGGIFAAIGLWPVAVRGQDPRVWSLVLAGVLLFPALLMPLSLKLPYRGWMAFGQALGWINTKIILGLVFYGLFMPMGLIIRVFGRRDPMRRGFDAKLATYRVVRQPRPASHMTRQF